MDVEELGGGRTAYGVVGPPCWRRGVDAVPFTVANQDAISFLNRATVLAHIELRISTLPRLTTVIS